MEEYSPERCAWCNGSGSVRQSLWGPNVCPVCNGQGSVKVLQPAMKCASCEGTGADKGSVWERKKCSICGGSGWAFTKSEKDQKALKFEQEAQDREFERRMHYQETEEKEIAACRRERVCEDRFQNEKISRKEDNAVTSAIELVTKADYYLENKLINDALNCYEAAITLDPKCSEAWTKKGKILEQLQKKDDALRCYIEAIWADPNNRDAWMGKSNLVKDRKEEIECLNNALKAKKTSKYSAGDLAIRYRILMKENPTGDINKWCEIAARYYNSGNFNDSILALDQILNKNPHDSWALKNKGNALINLKNFDEAIKCFNKILNANPNDTEALKTKGNALINLKSLDESIKCFNRALNANPNDIDALYKKGQIIYNLRKLDDAFKIFDHICELDEKHYAAHNYKGVIQYELKNFKKSIKIFENILENNPEFVDAWINKGLAIYHTKNFWDQPKLKEAIKCYEEAIKISPKNPYAWQNLGIALQDQGKNTEAIKAFAKANVYSKNSIDNSTKYFVIDIL